MRLLDIFQSPLAPPLQALRSPLFEKRGVAVYVKRDDLIHPYISGNKWHKLKYNLSRAVAEGYDKVISFGGAYSNHIHALAFAAKQAGLQSIGIIRGEPHQPLNATLQFARDQGMTLHYVSREQYRQKDSPDFIDSLLQRYGRCYVVPEGGTNALAVRGVSEMVSDIAIPFDFVCCACGTGGTLAGLIAGLQQNQHAIGFAALRGGEYLQTEVSKLLTSAGLLGKTNWHIESGYHFGGYAKLTRELKAFISCFEQDQRILLDPVYTAKLFYGVFSLIERGYFPRGATLVTVHSGGLQGRASLLPDSV